MSSVHHEELVLLSYLDGELDAATSTEVRTHLDRCEECRDYLTEADQTLRWQAETVRANLPVPPRAWDDLRVRLNDLDAERLQTRRPRQRRLRSLFS
jgi:anti-sigma factor RsiW